MLRVLLSVSLFLSILLLPWWVSTAIAIFLLMSKQAYEVLFGALLLDLLYGNFQSISDVLISFTVGAVLLFLAAHYLRGALIFYDNR
ncbi:MAG: hypothetical protein ISR99_01750 [Parcubacteria group bacterium]|nr:hypothetical protein [Parcubacteria group bacterium]